YLLVDLFAQAGYLAFGDTRHAHGFYKIINGSGRYALDVGLLNDRRQSLLGHAARLQEAREVAAGAKLSNAQLNGARPCLPVPVAIAVALGQSEAILLADPPPLNGSTLKYGFDHEGGPQWQTSATIPTRTT